MKDIVGRRIEMVSNYERYELEICFG